MTENDETRPTRTRFEADKTTSILAEYRARRDASTRLAPMRNGSVDPWAEQVKTPLPVTLDGCRAAWSHLFAVGLATKATDDYVTMILRDMSGAA